MLFVPANLARTPNRPHHRVRATTASADDARMGSCPALAELLGMKLIAKLEYVLEIIRVSSSDGRIARANQLDGSISAMAICTSK
jgi:hypothetical protein